MKHSYLVGLCLAVPSLALAHHEAEDLPVQILVDLHDDTTDEDERIIESKLGGLDLRLNSIHAQDERFFIADVDASELPGMVELLKDDPRVEHVEENYWYQALGKPNDPRYGEQWSFHMIEADKAWDLASGKGVTVAVIDTGVAYVAHKGYRPVEDLANIRFVKAYDFVSDTEIAFDDFGHGTHVAGTIAQATNNGVGVAGLAHRAAIMPLKVLNSRGFGSAADIADAIRYAADEGAQVMNLSLGGGARSLVMESAVRYARKKGVIVVCAAGNDGRGVVSFPAAYEGAFAVSSVGPDKRRAFYSNWGKEIAVAAPGGSNRVGGLAEGMVLQNTINRERPGQADFYAAFQGTSMAAPHVAGVAALVISAGVTDADQVERILRSTAEKPSLGASEQEYGAGIVNAYAAVSAAKGRTHGAPHLWAGLSLLAAFLWRGRRRALGTRATLSGAGAILGAAFGVLLGSSGLFFLEPLGLGGIFSAPPAVWDLHTLGAGWYRSALWASALPMFGAAIVFLGAKRGAGFLLGLTLGWAAHLAVTALLMPSNVQLIPGVAGLLDRAWLLANAALLLVLGVLLARRPR